MPSEPTEGTVVEAGVVRVASVVLIPFIIWWVGLLSVYFLGRFGRIFLEVI